MTVCKWNLENGGNKLIFHTAKPQAHFLTKLCFYYTSASEGRRGGGTGTMQPWSYPSGMIPAHPHSHLKVEYTLFHQKGHTVTWVPVQKLSIEQVFLSIWLNNVEFFFTKGRRLWGHTESDTTSDLAAAVYWKHICAWVGKIPWRRKWQTTPVFLPGKSLGQRSLAGYSPWGR